MRERLDLPPGDSSMVSLELDAAFDEGAGRYERYRMQASQSWADAELELADEGTPPTALPEVTDTVAVLVREAPSGRVAV